MATTTQTIAQKLDAYAAANNIKPATTVTPMPSVIKAPSPIVTASPAASSPSPQQTYVNNVSNTTTPVNNSIASKLDAYASANNITASPTTATPAPQTPIAQPTTSTPAQPTTPAMNTNALDNYISKGLVDASDFGGAFNYLTALTGAKYSGYRTPQPQDQAAIKDFQAKNGLTPSGAFDQATLTKMKQLLASKSTPTTPVQAPVSTPTPTTPSSVVTQTNLPSQSNADIAKYLQSLQTPTQAPASTPAPAQTASVAPQTAPKATLAPAANLSTGSTDKASVTQLQSLLGVTADGIFGPKTEAAVKAFQSSHGLTADGIVGPKTLAALNAQTSSTTPSTPATSTPTGSANPTQAQTLAALGTDPTNAEVAKYLQGLSNAPTTDNSVAGIAGILDKYAAANPDQIAQQLPSVNDALGQAGNQYINNQTNTTNTSTTPALQGFDQTKFISDYMAAMYPEGYSKAKSNLDALAEQQSQDIKLHKDEIARIKTNAQGALAEGLNDLLSKENAKFSGTEADLAIAQQQATDVLNQYIDMGKTYTEAYKAAYQAGQDAITNNQNQQKINIDQQNANTSATNASQKNADTSFVNLGNKTVLVDNKTGAVIQTFAEGLTPAQAKSSSGGSGSSAASTTLTSSQKSAFTNAGYTSTDITNILKEIDSLGLPVVYSKLDDQGKAALASIPQFQQTLYLNAGSPTAQLISQ